MGVQDSLTPYERMMRECKSLGITPLTAQEFEEEDRRIYKDMNARRHAVMAAPKTIEWGVYR